MGDILTFIRKNAGWYTLSMILTGLTSFGAIVITKRLFSPELFIDYNLKFNGVFMLNSICVTWLSISILRMYHNLKSFFGTDNMILLSLFTALILACPLFVSWYLFTKVGGSLLFPLLLICITVMHSIFLVTHQAQSNAKIVAFAEFVRGLIIILFLVIPLVFNLQVGEEYFWIAWILAYVIGLILLIYQNEHVNLFYRKITFQKLWPEYKSNLGNVLNYGIPNTILILLSYLLNYSDRIFMARNGMDLNQTSDYVALADAISRGCGFLFFPINISVYPIISKMFDEGDFAGTKMLIKKVLKIQIILVFVTAVILISASSLISDLLKISTNSWLFNAGLIFCFFWMYAIWQASSIIQKPFELKLQTGKLSLLAFFCTLLVYLLIFWVVKPQNPFYLIGCLSSGILLYTGINIYLLSKFLRDKNH